LAHLPQGHLAPLWWHSVFWVELTCCRLLRQDVGGSRFAEVLLSPTG
jgi:hypothetical protein